MADRVLVVEDSPALREFDERAHVPQGLRHPGARLRHRRLSRERRAAEEGTVPA